MHYEPAKQMIIDSLHLSKDAIHIYIGFGCLLVSVLVLRVTPSSHKVLILGILVSLGIEFLDLRNTLDYPQAIRWGGSAWDVLNTNAIPLLVVSLCRRAPIREGQPGG
jgi:hypothetical protein